MLWVLTGYLVLLYIASLFIRGANGRAGVGAHDVSAEWWMGVYARWVRTCAPFRRLPHRLFGRSRGHEVTVRDWFGDQIELFPERTRRALREARKWPALVASQIPRIAGRVK